MHDNWNWKGTRMAEGILCVHTLAKRLGVLQKARKAYGPHLVYVKALERRLRGTCNVGDRFFEWVEEEQCKYKGKAKCKRSKEPKVPSASSSGSIENES